MKHTSLILALLATTVTAAHTAKLDVRHANLTGLDQHKTIHGLAFITTLPSGDHEVLVRAANLPKGGPYHLHFAREGDATCAADNGSRVITLGPLVPDTDGQAMSFSKLNALVVFPKTKGDVQLHLPSSAAIACGAIEVIHRGGRN